MDDAGVRGRRLDAAEAHARYVVDKLRQAGFHAVWAGGCVRDRLLRRKPKDYDVATNARPDQIREVFGRRRTLAIGAAFGVITVLGPPEAGAVEVATFRRDATYSDGRHPDAVEFCDAEEDAQRRDFTINGLFYDPVREQVLDYVGGRNDLRDGLIRAIGEPERRIDEDKLRMLRAIRFAATFHFQVFPTTMQAIQHHADQIRMVSAERIGNELQHMLMLPRRAAAAGLLGESRLLAALTGELGARRSPHETAARWPGMLATLDALPKDSERAAELFPAALAALLDCLTESPGELEAQARRWRLANHDAVLARRAVEGEQLLANAHRLAWSEVQPVLAGPDAEVLVEFAAARVVAAGEDPQGVEFCRRRRNWPSEELNPRPLVDGQDLIRLGLQPGPEFKSLLQEIRNRQLDGLLRDFDDALAWLKRRLKA